MDNPIPQAHAMLLCDQVITEQHTGKKSLIGIFENISSPKFPCAHLRLALYMKFSDASGRYQFRVELVFLDDDKKIGEGVTAEIEYRDRLRVNDLTFNLGPLTFAKPGKYEFRLYANNKLWAQKSFQVLERHNDKTA